MNASEFNKEKLAIDRGPQPDQVIDRCTHPIEAGLSTQTVGMKLQVLGFHVVCYGLALVILWIGLMKFTAYEAEGIQPLVASSPLMGWMYSILSVRQFSTGLGIVEVTIAALIALRPWFLTASVVGSAAATFMFLTTLSSCSLHLAGSQVWVDSPHYLLPSDSS